MLIWHDTPHSLTSCLAILLQDRRGRTSARVATWGTRLRPARTAQVPETTKTDWKCDLTGSPTEPQEPQGPAAPSDVTLLASGRAFIELHFDAFKSLSVKMLVKLYHHVFMMCSHVVLIIWISCCLKEALRVKAISVLDQPVHGPLSLSDCSHIVPWFMFPR